MTTCAAAAAIFVTDNICFALSAFSVIRIISSLDTCTRSRLPLLLSPNSAAADPVPLPLITESGNVLSDAEVPLSSSDAVWYLQLRQRKDTTDRSNGGGSFGSRSS